MVDASRAEPLNLIADIGHRCHCVRYTVLNVISMLLRESRISQVPDTAEDIDLDWTVMVKYVQKVLDYIYLLKLQEEPHRLFSSFS